MNFFGKNPLDDEESVVPKCTTTMRLWFECICKCPQSPQTTANATFSLSALPAKIRDFYIYGYPEMCDRESDDMTACFQTRMYTAEDREVTFDRLSNTFLYLFFLLPPLSLSLSLSLSHCFCFFFFVCGMQAFWEKRREAQKKIEEDPIEFIWTARETPHKWTDHVDNVNRPRESPGPGPAADVLLQGARAVPATAADQEPSSESDKRLW